ncbi:hypothetical protein CPB86DRAFT_875934 [Serendipita vermifera]|nr:hypothetical protein CPB86DRAFT_875934 [Serendipita vermifera]
MSLELPSDPFRLEKTLVAAVEYFTKQGLFTWEYFLKNSLTHEDPVKRDKAFREFGTHALCMAFTSPKRLSQTFEFTGDTPLKDEVAELVSVQKVDSGFSCTPVDLSYDAPSAYRLAFDARSDVEVLSWLNNPKKAVSCLFPEGIGPDRIFVLRLADHTVLRVVVQFKCLAKGTATPEETTEVFNQMDPEKFMGEELSYVDRDFRDQIMEALGSLGQGTHKAGTLGVLCVVVRSNGSFHQQTLEELVKNDKYRHPVAIVDADTLIKGLSGVNFNQSLIRNLLAVRAHPHQREE